jgi:outer membrane lipoprotein-sorting protein
MKKILLALAIVVMIVSLSACASETAEGASSIDSDEEAAEALEDVSADLEDISESLEDINTDLG